MVSTVAVSYPKYADCKRYYIKPVPWEWGRAWVSEQTQKEVQTLGVIVNEATGNFLEVYKRIPQVHMFHNILYGSSSFPFHAMSIKFNVLELENCTEQFDQIISWDSSVFFMDKYDRLRFWKQIDRLLKNNAIVSVSFVKFLRVSKEFILFMNSSLHKSLNHHYRGEVDEEDFSHAPRLGPLMVLAKKKKLFLSDEILTQKNEFICPRHVDLIDMAQFPDPVEAYNCLENSIVSWEGIHIVL